MLALTLVWKTQPLLGKPSDASAKEKRQGESVILDLVEDLKGHIVTIYKFFLRMIFANNFCQKTSI